MIKLKSDGLRATLMARGATLTGLWHHSSARSLVLGTPDPARYGKELLYAGVIVGPVANRISGARVTIGGAIWQLPDNDGGNCLHNGPAGLHAQDWLVEEQSDSAVTFAVELEHGAAGLPGHRRITARYVLSDAGTLDLTICATSNRLTLMNPAHHPYWTLDDLGPERHSLQLHAERYLETGDQTLPTGRILPVTGSDYDFRQPRAIPVDRVLDANCCLADHALPEPRAAAVLTGSGGLRLDIETTAPGLQVYNGANLANSSIPMHPGQVLAPFAGIALEPQAWPDAPSHSAFPSVILSPEVPLMQRTIYRISR